MTLPEMNAVVGADLRHIPAGPTPQGLLRAVYQNARMASLGRKRPVGGTAPDVLQWSLRQLKGHYPGHTFEYDEAYFQSKGGHA